MCIPEAELEVIIKEEVTKAIEEAVRIAVAEERGRRIRAQTALYNAQFDLEYSLRREKLAWTFTAISGAVMVTWFVLELSGIHFIGTGLP